MNAKKMICLLLLSFCILASVAAQTTYIVVSVPKEDQYASYLESKINYYANDGYVYLQCVIDKWGNWLLVFKKEGKD